MKEMQLDAGITYDIVRAAVSALKTFRGKSAPLDRLLDALPNRRVAHVAEEALRAAAATSLEYVGLWRYNGTDERLLSYALKQLNSLDVRNTKPARTNL
jgi:hypothetical protein